MAKRPSFTKLWGLFKTIYGDGTVTSVGAKIGGKVGQNIELGVTNPKDGFTNACAIRLSYTFNYAGTPVGHGAWSTVSGADRKQYIFRVRDLVKFMRQTFGKPDKVVKKPEPVDFAGLQGLLVFDVSGWDDATGHATLWNGNACSDHCYFPKASEASLWTLK